MAEDFRAIIDAEVLNKMVSDNEGNLITLDELLQPGFYSACRRCPLYKCPMRVDEPTEEYDDHCRIEEGALIEITKEFVNEGGSLSQKATLVSLFDNYVLKLRMARVGSQINYISIVDNPKMLGVLDKYVSMMMSIDRRYMAAVKEMQLTPKEKDAKKKEQVNTAKLIADMMTKAKNIDTKDIDEETEGEKAYRLKPAYDSGDDKTELTAKNR